MENRPWSDLPDDLLAMIFARSPPSEHPCIGAVCKNWKKVLAPVYPADIGPLLTYFKKWGDGIFHFYSPVLNKTFKVDCPHTLSDTRFYFSRHGWLVLGRKHEVILVDPVADTVHRFPGLHARHDFVGIAFDERPPNDCTIFAIESTSEKFVNISIWCCGGWHEDERFPNQHPFIVAPHSSPVIFHGRFYCLGENGTLGYFNPVSVTWTVLQPKGFPNEVDESYLVESEGRLLVVLVSNHDLPVRVLRLDKRKTVWETIRTLGYHSLFLGPGVSIATTAPLHKMKNTVFQARLLGVPETIAAELRKYEGRTYFIPKPNYAYYDPQEGPKKRETKRKGGICSYSLEKGAKRCRYYGSIEYPCCIWYDPSIYRTKIDP